MFRRHPRSIQTCLWSLCCVVGMGHVALAQGQIRAQTATNDPKLTDQQAPQMEVRLPPELEQILLAWEAKTKDIKRMKGKFKRYEYDSVFSVEKRTIGNFWFSEPDQARMDFRPDTEIPNPAVNTVNGVQYTVQPDDPKSWICTGEYILDIDVKNRTYNRVHIPVGMQGQNIRNGPLPFLFGMDAESVKQRYRLALGSMNNPQGGKVHIVAYPLMAAQRREFQRAELLLDATNFLPQAVKLWDSAGTKETVYLFYDHSVNGFQFPIPNPFRPSLGGFKIIEDYKAPEDAEQNTSLNSGTSPTRSAGGQSGILVR